MRQAADVSGQAVAQEECFHRLPSQLPWETCLSAKSPNASGPFTHKDVDGQLPAEHGKKGNTRSILGAIKFTPPPSPEIVLT